MQKFISFTKEISILTENIQLVHIKHFTRTGCQIIYIIEVYNTYQVLKR